MQDELHELLDSAVYKEIASEALYQSLANKTDDPGAVQLLHEMAGEEKKHKEWLETFHDTGGAGKWHRGTVRDLKISDYLQAPETMEGAGLQDTLIFAMKREQQSIEFYSRMTAVFTTAKAKRLCQKLAGEEIRHKVRLETLYESVFLGED